MKTAQVVILSFSLALGLNACLSTAAFETSDWVRVSSISPAAFNGDDGPEFVRVTLLNMDRIQYNQPVIRADSLIADAGAGRSVALAHILSIEAWNGDGAPEADYEDEDEDEEDSGGMDLSFEEAAGLALLVSLLLGLFGL